MHTIEIYLEDGGWMTKTDDPDAVELFGTSTIPTPFLEATPVEKVKEVLERLNPDCTILVRGAYTGCRGCGAGPDEGCECERPSRLLS